MKSYNFAIVYRPFSANTLEARWARHLAFWLTEASHKATLVAAGNSFSIPREAETMDFDVVIAFNSGRIKSFKNWDRLIHLCWMDDAVIAGLLDDNQELVLSSDIIYSSLPRFIWNFDYFSGQPDPLWRPILPGGEPLSGTVPICGDAPLSFYGASVLVDNGPVFTVSNGEITFNELCLFLLKQEMRNCGNTYSDVFDSIDILVSERMGRPYRLTRDKDNTISMSKLFHKFFKSYDRGTILRDFVNAVPGTVIFGDGRAWEKNAAVRDAFVGPIGDIETALSIMNASQGHIHYGAMSLHYRVMDGIANGCNMLVNRTTHDMGDWDIRNYFEPGKHYFEYDIDSVAEDSVRFMRDFPKGSLGDRARDVYSANHTWQHCVERMLADLSSL